MTNGLDTKRHNEVADLSAIRGERGIRYDYIKKFFEDGLDSTED